MASTNWGADKYTLRNLYLGYIGSTIEYANSILIIGSESSKRTLDKIQNNALRFICGGLRSTPTAACEIDVNVEPLHIRREKSVLEMYERYMRLDNKHQCKSIANKWVQRTRLKKKSILHHHKTINMQANLPTQRLATTRINQIPPYEKIHSPIIKYQLINGKSCKRTNQPQLGEAAMDTINSYPPSWIHAYTDGSAFNGVAYAGAGALIKFPNKTISLKSPCGIYCSNHDAETKAIHGALDNIETEITTVPLNIFIFTDSLSALQSADNQNSASCTIQT